MNDNGTQELVAGLQRAIGVEQVRFDHMTRLLYSTDASNYQIMPVGVTFPRDADEVVAIHEIALKHRTPVLPRGGGSSLAGQTVGKAIVMDFSRHIRNIRGVDTETGSVMVEPGLVLAQLNRHLATMGLMYGPDPASADRATIGGCIGNNSTGAHSIVYGMFSDHIRRLEVVLASGERVWLDARNDTLDAVRGRVRELALAHADEISARYPKTWRSTAGYGLNRIDPENVDLKWLFAGSEGTLGTIVQAELNLVSVPKMKRLAMVHFDSARASLEATPRILETDPSAVELMDRFLMDKTRANPEFARRLTFVGGDPEAVLIVEYYGENGSELDSKVETLRALLQRIGHRGTITYATGAKEQANVWAVRKAGLGLLMSERVDAKPIPFIEDAAVPVEHLADYIDDVAQIVHDAGTTYAMYAHASAGCLHVRPLINLKTTQGHEQYRRIGEAVADLVVKYGGTITGEHGKGLARGALSERLFGPELTGAFREIKQAFDPDNLMNPGKVVDVGPMDDPATLRYTPDYETIQIETRYDWSADGGLSGAAEMCNGAGVCRNDDVGTMCPTYRATLDESKATRGRANALRLAMSGRLGSGGLGNSALKEMYDLCVACKGCKSECPSSVDMARMRAEFLAAYYDIHGIPFTTRVFANIHRLNRLGSLWPAFSNFMLSNPIGKLGMKLFGLPTERPLPEFASRRFSKSTKPAFSATNPQATLIVDTFVEYNHPEVGGALLKIVDALGVGLNVMRLPGQGCCGRPAISKGMLDLAKEMATENVRYLSERLDAGPFIFLEPGCLSTFTDDYLTLVDPELQPKAARLAEQCISAEKWLAQQLEDANLIWDEHQREILLHGHCHQKALWGTEETLRLLRAIPNATVSEIDSGCCGMAGSFGYEHRELSLKIANQRLIPAIKAKPSALVAAPGTSCRAQIGEAGHDVWHPVEIVAAALK